MVLRTVTITLLTESALADKLVTALLGSAVRTAGVTYVEYDIDIRESVCMCGAALTPQGECPYLHDPSRHNG